MGYIGPAPTSGFISNAKERYTGITTAYVDLNHSISSLADVIVWVNYVKQDATNLTLTSSTRITLGGTLVSADIVEVAYLGKAVSTQAPATGQVTNDMLAGSIADAKISAMATSKLTGTVSQSQVVDQAINEAKMQISNAGTNGQYLSKQSGNTGGLTWASISGGLSNADYWCKGADQSINAQTGTVITGSWAQQQGRGGGGNELGSGLSESSGVFTFPSTGIWYVTGWFRCVKNGDTRYINLSLEVTTDGSAYNSLGFGSGKLKNHGDDAVTQLDASALIDCTDTTSIKFRFLITADESISIGGDSSYTQSGVIAIKLGDT